MSIEIHTPLSIWVQISSFFFFLAGIFSDLLIIRLSLSSAYVFLFLNAVLGAPLWPLWNAEGRLQVDAIVWCVANLYVHVTTLVRLLNDERSITLPKDHEALWRAFFRIGGLSKQVFRELVSEHCTVVTLEKDDKADTGQYFYVIYEGTVKITVTDVNGKMVSCREAQSGQLFDFRVLGFLDDIPSSASNVLEALVVSPSAKLFRFPKDRMGEISNNPRTRLMWKELLMENLLRIVQRYFDRRDHHGSGQPRNEFFQRQAKLRYEAVHNKHPMFVPLQDWEQPHPLRAGSNEALKHPLAHIWASMGWSIAPPWPFKGPPIGLRHDHLLAPNKQDTDEEMPQKKSLVGFGSLQTMEPSSATGKLQGTPEEQEVELASHPKYAKDDDGFLHYLNEMDEEFGGLSMSFKKDISWKAEGKRRSSTSEVQS